MLLRVLISERILLALTFSWLSATNRILRRCLFGRSASCLHAEIPSRVHKLLPVLARAFDEHRMMRPSPAAIISTSQLLIGRFTRSSGLALAFTGRCLSQRPPGDGDTYDADVIGPAEQAIHLKREIDCSPWFRGRVSRVQRSIGRIIFKQGTARS